MDLARSVYSRDLKIIAMRALDAGSSNFSLSEREFSSLRARARQRQERAKPVHSSLSTPLPRAR